MEDLDREVEELAKEARKKLDEESKQRPDEAPPTLADVAEATSVERAAEAARAVEHEDEGDGDGLLLRGVAALALIIGLWLVASYVVAPLVKIAAIVLVLAAITWFVWKVTGGGASNDPPGDV